MPRPAGGRAGGSSDCRLRLLLVLPIVVLLRLLVCTSAHAQLPEQVRIAWDDEASCPRPLRVSLESEVARLLGPSARTTQPSHFDVTVERTSGREPYRLTLSVRSDAGRADRTLQLASCEEAQDAAALLIATAIDPAAMMREQPPPPPPEAPREEPATVKPPVVPHAWSLLLSALFDASSLPAPTGGPDLGVLFARARLRTWATTRYLFARRSERARDSAPSVVADVDLFAASLGGTYVWPLGALVVGPAAGLELGVLRARGAGASQGAAALREAGAWGAVQLGAVAAYAVQRRVGLELSVLAGLPLWRPALAVRDQDAFYTTSPVTMRVAVGMRISLGSR